MKRWMWYGVLILVTLVGAWGAVRTYRATILAREAAERAEERTEFVRDSTRRVIAAAEEEIKAAQGRVIELTERTVKLEKELNAKIGETDESLDELEAAVPDSMRTLVRQLRSTIRDERLVWASKDVAKDNIIAEKDIIIAQTRAQRRADSLLILTQADEIGKWKKAANASFKFNVGSTMVTAGATALITLGFVAVAQ